MYESGLFTPKYSVWRPKCPAYLNILSGYLLYRRASGTAALDTTMCDDILFIGERVKNPTVLASRRPGFVPARSAWYFVRDVMLYDVMHYLPRRILVAFNRFCEATVQLHISW